MRQIRENREPKNRVPDISEKQPYKPEARMSQAVNGISSTDSPYGKK